MADAAGNERDRGDHSFDGTIVALGASAGGLDALDRFFTSLDAIDSAAFVVIQHLAPEHTSMMDTLLARHSTIPFSVAEDGMLLVGGHVYVIPPGTVMTVSDSRLRLVARPTGGVTLPIDAFFRSLADEAPMRSIGIVLSGTGSDGTRGIAALHGAGAWVMAQDPETAKFDGMPLSAIESRTVDHVLAPEALAATVASIVASGELPPERIQLTHLAVDDASIDEVLQMLADTMQIDFSQYKPAMVLRRVERRLQATRRETIGAYREYLASEPGEIDVLRHELLIPVTRFFRDPDAFEALREALEELVRSRAADTERPLRVWVTACATGEEAYSIAMVLLDLVEQHAPRLDVKLFATDVEASYVERASSGSYTSAQMANVPDHYRDRWFDEGEGGSWRCRPSLRSHFVFSRHDLLVDAPFTRLDLVACRNLLIYLRPFARDRALRRLSYALGSGGILFLGTSESPGSSSGNYEPIDVRQKIYRLVRRPASLPPGDFLGDAVGPIAGARRPLSRTTDRSVVHSPVNQAIEELSRRYAPPSLIITAGRRLVHTFGDTRDLLHFGNGDVSLDVVNLLPPTLTPVVATLVHGAVRDRTAQRSRGVPVTLIDEATGGERTEVYRVAVWPISDDSGAVEHLVVSFEPAGDSVERRGVELIESDVASMRDRHLDDLERELALTSANLQDTIQELGTTNEELQATNEESTASNEELQSTNEELQSVNEELHSLNAEYQSKIEELNNVYADLESLTRATRIPLVFLDAELHLTRFTPAASALFRFRASDVGRLITDFSHSLDYPDLYDVARRTLDDLVAVQREVPDAEGRTWLVTVLPYAPSATQYTRIVITCVDVSSMRDVQRLQSTLDALPEHVAVLAPDGQILMVNRMWSQFGVDRDGVGRLSSAVGSNYLDEWRADSDPAAARVLTGLTDVLNGDLPTYVAHHSVHSPTERRWFMMHVTPVDQGGCVVTHYDVTGWIDPDRIDAEVES